MLDENNKQMEEVLVNLYKKGDIVLIKRNGEEKTIQIIFKTVSTLFGIEPGENDNIFYFIKPTEYIQIKP